MYAGYIPTYMYVYIRLVCFGPRGVVEEKRGRRERGWEEGRLGGLYIAGWLLLVPKITFRSLV
jgi:hypothetical protein